MSYDVFEDIRREMERLRKRVQEEIERTLEMITPHVTPSWSPDGSLRPLYNIYEYPDRYVVLVDLAGADAGSIEVRATEDHLILEAKLQREMSYSDVYGTSVGRELVFNRYRHVIPLPPDADPQNIRVNVRPNKLVEIVIPRKR